MNYTKGFAGITILLIVLGIIALGGIGYVAKDRVLSHTYMESQNDGVQTAPGDHPETDHSAMDGVAASTSISWKFTSVGEKENIPYTTVSVTVNGTEHKMGDFQGSCSEIGATGGVDGKGLLAGEISAAQCWFAGGGDEIGVFANEDGGYDIMVGGLSESIEGSAGFRGDFKVKTSIKL